MSTFQECFFRDDAGPQFGWNWTRKHTEPNCTNGKCKAPECYADFTYMALTYGVSPFGGKHPCPPNMPVNITALDKFVIRQNVSFAFIDTAPTKDPPQTSTVAAYHNDSRRTRFIYDFFLTSVRPNGTNIAHSITDEVTIDLAGNPHFPGSQVCVIMIALSDCTKISYAN